jgi:hypothetical protein
MWTMLLNNVFWIQKDIFSMDKKKEMIVTIFFFGQGIINDFSGAEKE